MTDPLHHQPAVMKFSLSTIRCGNNTHRGGVCKRWVPLGAECPNHGVPFIVRYPDTTDIFEMAVVSYWKNTPALAAAP